jgi:hypothetical protein
MKMAMENSGIELTTDYVKTKLLQEGYLPTNGDSRGTGGSAYVTQYRSRFDESGKGYAKNRRCKEDVSTERSSNSTRYFKGPCFICNRKDHKAANCYKNPNREKFQRVEDQKKRRQNTSLLAAMAVTMRSEKWNVDSGATQLIRYVLKTITILKKQR